MTEKRIVILGGGFAGLQCARELRRRLSKELAEIVLFNQENHTVFHPLLAEVVSAALQPKDVGAPIRQLLDGVWCRTEQVLNIDLQDNAIEYESHKGVRRRLSYDQLVIALGKGANLGLVPGMDEHAFALKTIGDALALQAHIMEQMEKAEVCDDEDERRRYLSFIVVGGGFSGVEVAGEINDLVRSSRKFFKNIKDSDYSVSIIHSREQILPEVTESMRQFARKKMEEAGVTMILNAVAARATANGVILRDGRVIAGNTIVCTVGTVTLPVIARLSVAKSNDRLVCATDLSLPGHKNVWAVGDCAAIVNGLDGKLCPPIAQFAERQGKLAAQNIVARLNGEETKAFSYQMKGLLCSIGGRCAVAEISGLRLSGFPAWFLWRGVYLMKLPSITQKIKVGMEWACDLVFPRCLAHLKADRSNRVYRAYFAPGDYVFREGDAAIDFYVIQSGEVDILRRTEPRRAGDTDEIGVGDRTADSRNVSSDGISSDDDNQQRQEEVIAVLGAGDFFGEAALVDSRPRNASVRARTDLEVVILGASVFSQMSSALSPLRDAVAAAIKRRTRNARPLGDYKTLIENISLSSVTDPLPSDPFGKNDPIEYAIARVNDEKLDFGLVVDENNHLIGILTRSDLLRAVELAMNLPKVEFPALTVKDIMVADPIAISRNESTALAMLTMREHGLKRVPVIETALDKTPIGYVRIEHLLDRIHRQLRARDRVKSASGLLTREIELPS